MNKTASESSASKSEPKEKTEDWEAFCPPGYRFTKKLEGPAGSFAWLVEENVSGNRGILKIMPKSESDVEQRFHREMEIIKQLKHENIVKLYEAGCYKDERFYYMLQEYCEGGNLRAFIEEKKRQSETLSMERAVHIEMQILDALDYAHNRKFENQGLFGDDIVGVVHRNINPDNIFIAGYDGENPRVKVGGWGLAKPYQLAGLSGISLRNGPAVLSGKLDYVPIEQLINPRYSEPKADVWSAAAVLFYMLTGLPPRERDAIGTIIVGRYTGLRQVEKYRQDLPPALVKALNGALKEQPKLSVTSAALLRESIRNAVNCNHIG